MWRALCEDVRRNAIDEVLAHQPGSEHPAACFHALRKFDLAGAELDRKERLCSARDGFGWHCRRLPVGFSAWVCAIPRYGLCHLERIPIMFEHIRHGGRSWYILAL